MLKIGFICFCCAFRARRGVFSESMLTGAITWGGDDIGNARVGYLVTDWAGGV